MRLLLILAILSAGLVISSFVVRKPDALLPAGFYAGLIGVLGFGLSAIVAFLIGKNLEEK